MGAEGYRNYTDPSKTYQTVCGICGESWWGPASPSHKHSWWARLIYRLKGSPWPT